MLLRIEVPDIVRDAAVRGRRDCNSPGKPPELKPMSADARAFWIARPGFGEIRDEDLPSPAAGDVVVRTRYSGVSRGTEALVFKGRVPVTEYQRMRAPFQAGDFPAPIKYGYASVGLVERGPAELKDRLVFVLHPHQTRYVVPAASVHLIPEAVPPRRGVLTANLETAINGIWDAEPKPGDRIVVVGAGAVGCLCAWLAGRIPGCDVQLVDVNPTRVEVARALGVRFAEPAHAEGDADVVIHATGSAAGLATALRVAGFEAVVVELSWYGDQEVPIPLGQAFHSRRLTLRSSQVGSVASTQRARWSTARRMQLALSLLTDSSFDALLTGESDFESLPHVMAELAASPGATICHCIRYA
jgi:threonine dehydrogenase-like Zn-dependent dehydrogenase